MSFPIDSLLMIIAGHRRAVVILLQLQALPVENKDVGNCTLFEVKTNISGSEYSFTHVQSGCQLTYSDSSSWHVVLGTNGSSFEVKSFALLVRLPKRVIFKGDNGNYLRGRKQQRKPLPIQGVGLALGVCTRTIKFYFYYCIFGASCRLYFSNFPLYILYIYIYIKITKSDFLNLLCIYSPHTQ